jgi:hypothetical protein
MFDPSQEKPARRVRVQVPGEQLVVDVEVPVGPDGVRVVVELRHGLREWSKALLRELPDRGCVSNQLKMTM